MQWEQHYDIIIANSCQIKPGDMKPFSLFCQVLVDPPQLGLQVRTAPIILFKLGSSHISEKKINFLSKTIFTYFVDKE